MRRVGIATTVLGGVIVAVAATVGIRSIPDIKRYLRIRQM